MNPRARAKRGKGVRPRRTGGGGGLRLLTDVLHRWRCRRPTDSALVNQCRNTQLHDPRTAHLARASHAPSSPAIELCTPGAAPAHRPQMPPATSETNFAIEIDPPDGDAHSLDDAEAEAGITSSRCHLMHNFEEERPASLVASIQESAKSSARKAKHYLSYVLDPLKKVLSSMKLLILIAIYSLLGAYLFMWLEVPNDLATKEEKYHKRKIAREVMVLNLRAIYFENRDDREERWKSAILSFEEGLELSEPVIETDWSFWMAFLYAGTIYTTIGYGNIACKTRGGQIATMLYAFIGIPIMLVMLTSLNNFLLKWMRIIANTLSDLILYTGVKLGLTKLQEGSKQRARYLAFCRKLNRSGLVATTSLTTVATSEGKKSVVDVEAATAEDEDEEDPAPDPPLFSALFTTVGWIMLSAAVFCLFEDWTFFTSFYFCFISLSTIGLGDVTPANPEYMIATFGVVIVGLSMLTVCIDVVKEKLALMYMALLEKLLKDYMDAVQSGDPNATSGLMAGFQGKAMFLMPLISKDQGAKVMTRFKEDCEKKGIAPPPVLTNIDPETGMPAFATASKDDFKDYIEVAEEKTKRNPTPEPKPVMVTKTTLTDSAPKQIPKPQMTVGITQTSTPSETIDLYSFSVQFNSSPPNAQFSMQTDIVEYSDSGFQTDSSESSDEGIQTDIAESSDEGIQTWIPGSDICVQFDTPQVPDLPKDTADSATQITLVEKNSTGVQPEVSSIYFADEDETESYLSEESEESDDYDEGLDDVEEEMPDVEKVDAPLGPRGAEIEQLVGQMPQSPPIEIIAATDTEQPSTAEEQPTATDTENRLSARNLKMQKSVSVESQETIIHVPQGDESKKKKLTAAEREKRKEEKERKQKERETRRETRRQARGLRFMKNSGDQTTPSDANDVGVQYEQFSIESSSQYDRIETRGRRSQTKLSGINQAQLGVVKESVRRKRRQRRDQLQQQHERRQHDDGEVSESGADSEREFDQQRRFERTQSSSQADIGADPSMASNSNSDVEEISLNLSVVSLAVDEHGNPVNAEDNSSDIESAEEELELLWIDGYTQTEQKTWRDQQDEVTPTALNIVVHSLTQTSISTFHRREAKTETEASSSTVEATQVDAPNTTDSKTQDKVSFMRESGAQTLQTSFYAEPSEPKESVEVAVGADEDVEGEMVNLLFLVDETTQTSFVDEKATITVDAEQSTAMSTGIQTSTGYFGREADTQTEWKGEVMRGTQTASDVRDEVVQTDEKHGKEIEIQTTKLRQRHKLCQTHVKEQAERDSQTEVVHNIQETGVQALMTDVNDTAVDATTDLRTQQVQSDVSMFVVDQMDRSKLEVVHDVRFNVDSSTQADLVNSIDSSTQSESLEMDSVEVQVTPSMTTSHTQHTHICSSDHTSQTEANMRSRYSQGVSAVQETIESSASSVSEMRSTPMQVETQRVDQGVQPEAPTATECGVDPIFELVSRASQYELHTNERASEARVDTTDVGFNVYIDVASEVETKETGTQNSTDLVDKSCDSLAIEQKTQWAQCESVTENKGTDTALLVLVEEVAIQNSDDVAEIALSPIRIEYQDSSTSPPPGSDAHNQFVQAAYDVVETGSDAFYLGVSVAVQEIVDVLDEASGVLYFGTAEVAVQSSADTVDHSTTCDEKVETCDTASDAVIILPDTSSIASQTQVDSKETTCATDPTPTEDRSCDVIIIPGVDAGLQAVVESQEKSSGEQLLTASRSVDIPDEAELDIGILSSAGKLWGDFDYIYEAVSPETSQDVQTSLVVITADNAAQAQPEVAESKTQTLRFKKKKEKVADKMDVTKIEKADQNVEARVETAEGVVQAVADTAEQSAGFDGDDDDWLQVYVQELDQERRLRMLDIGIQTGVLARVQHMYTRRPSMSDEPSSSAAPITLRKSSESSEQLTMRHARGSEESLARTTSAMSMADSTDDRSPFQSRDSSRQSSLKRPTRARDIERAIERSQVVTDLRARFETRSSTSPRDSREALRKEPPPPPLERKDSSE